MPYFCPFAAHFGGFEGIFSYRNDKSAILCPAKTEVADFVSFKGLIVQVKNKLIIFQKTIDNFQKKSILIRFNGEQLDGRFGEKKEISICTTGLKTRIF